MKCFFMGQISAAISEMSEANKDLLEKYRKEVALRRKYHEQLVELKGGQGNQVSGQEVDSGLTTLFLLLFVGPQATFECCVA